MNLIKTCKSLAICLIIGSILLVAGYQLRPGIAKENLDEFANAPELWSSILVPIGAILSLIGILGVCMWEVCKKANAKILSYLILFTGTAAFYLGTLALNFALPVLVAHKKETFSFMYSDEPPFPRFAIFWLSGLVFLVVGLFWVGIRILRTKNYSPIAGVLLIAGAVVSILTFTVDFALLKPASWFIMAGFVALGISLINKTKETVINDTAFVA